MTEPALGLIWDGTGYGTDGTIWGGECLLGDAAGFERVAHLRPFRLPGGEAAVREPRRVALALLWEIYGDDVFAWEWLAPVRSFAAAERRLLGTMLARGVNAPVTTSMGRLFDGVAALIGLRQQVTFEGEAAMELEYCARRDDAGDAAAYALPLVARGAGEPHLLDWAPLIDGILADLRRDVPAATMAARFHAALVECGGGGRCVRPAARCAEWRLLPEPAAHRGDGGAAACGGPRRAAAPPDAAQRRLHQPGANHGGGGAVGARLTSPARRRDTSAST